MQKSNLYVSKFHLLVNKRKDNYIFEIILISILNKRAGCTLYVGLNHHCWPTRMILRACTLFADI